MASIFKRLLFAIFPLALFASSYAGDVSVEVRPDPLVVGSTAQLVIISNQSAYPEIISMPEIPGLRWLGNVNSRSQSTTVINGKSTSCFTSIYGFVPEKEGELVIPAMQLSVGSKKVLTDPLKLRVVKRSEDPVANKIDSLLFFKADILSDRKEFYVGEEIPVEIRLYGSKKITYRPVWPEFELGNAVFRDYSSVNRENPHFDRLSQSQEKVGSESFLVWYFRTAFRPIAPGQMQVKITESCIISLPGSNRGNFFEDDFFSIGDPFGRGQQQRVNLEPCILNLLVKPLPTAPEQSSFLGLVGDWELKADLPSGAWKAGDPKTFKLFVNGKGTLDTLKAPELQAPGFRIYPPEVEKHPSQSGNFEKAELSYVMIPLEKGPVELAWNFSSFDTKGGTYRELPVKGKFEIEKGDSSSGVSQAYLNAMSKTPDAGSQPDPDAQRKPSGILYLKKELDGTVALPLWANNVFVVVFLFILGPFVWGISEFWHRRRERLANDPAYRRKLEARGRRREILKKLQAATPENFDAIFNDELVPYLNDLMGYPPGTSATEIAERLPDRELAECLKDASQALYMPGAAPREALRARLGKVFLKSALSLLLIASGFSLFAEVKIAVSVPNSAPEAIASYDKGDFEAAGKFYQKCLDPKNPSAAVLYNLGNCLYNRGELAAALVCYERARRLSPRDSDILENTNFVRRKLFLPEVGRAENPAKLLENMRDMLRPDQWLFLSAFCVAAAGFLLAARRFRSFQWKLPLVGTLLLSVAALFLIFWQYESSYSSANGMVLGKNVIVHNLPSEDATLASFRLKSGEELRIEEQREDWVRVRAANVEGWVKKSDVARLWTW